MGVNQGPPNFSLSVFPINRFQVVASVGSSVPITVRVINASWGFSHSSKSTAKLPTGDLPATFQVPTKILKHKGKGGEGDMGFNWKERVQYYTLYRSYWDCFFGL